MRACEACVWWTGRDLNPSLSLVIVSCFLSLVDVGFLVIPCVSMVRSVMVFLPLSFSWLSVCVSALAKIGGVLRRVYIAWSFLSSPLRSVCVLGHY